MSILVSFKFRHSKNKETGYVSFWDSKHMYLVRSSVAERDECVLAKITFRSINAD